MKARRLISDLRCCGVVLEVDGEQLCVEAPAGMFDGHFATGRGFRKPNSHNAVSGVSYKKEVERELICRCSPQQRASPQYVRCKQLLLGLGMRFSRYSSPQISRVMEPPYNPSFLSSFVFSICLHLSVKPFGYQYQEDQGFKLPGNSKKRTRRAIPIPIAIRSEFQVSVRYGVS